MSFSLSLGRIYFPSQRKSNHKNVLLQKSMLLNIAMHDGTHYVSPETPEWSSPKLTSVASRPWRAKSSESSSVSLYSPCSDLGLRCLQSQHGRGYLQTQLSGRACLNLSSPVNSDFFCWSLKMLQELPCLVSVLNPLVTWQNGKTKTKLFALWRRIWGILVYF